MFVVYTCAHLPHLQAPHGDGDGNRYSPRSSLQKEVTNNNGYKPTSTLPWARIQKFSPKEAVHRAIEMVIGCLRTSPEQCAGRT